MTAEWALGVAGAIILILFGVIGSMLRADRGSISADIKAGFAEVKALIAVIDSRQRQTDKDCVPWEEFDKLRKDFVFLDKRQTIVETTCSNNHHGKAI